MRGKIEIIMDELYICIYIYIKLLTQITSSGFKIFMLLGYHEDILC